MSKVLNRNRYRTSLGIHKTIIVPDYELLEEEEQGIFHDETRSLLCHRTVKEKKVNSIISLMFSKTSWFFKVARSACPKVIASEFRQVLKSPAASTGIVGI